MIRWTRFGLGKKIIKVLLDRDQAVAYLVKHLNRYVVDVLYYVLQLTMKCCVMVYRHLITAATHVQVKYYYIKLWYIWWDG